MKYIDQRQSPRVDIRLDCRISWPGLGSPCSMVTENISRTGMLVAWDLRQVDLPEIGQIVTIEVELPAYHGFGRKCIHCQASVLRVINPESDMPRLALNVNSMRFQAFRENMSALDQLEAAGAGGWLS